MSSVKYTVDGSTATITLDAPENRNAINQALLKGIDAGVSKATADDAVRSIVLTHTGSVFCAGADLKESSAAPTGDSDRPSPAAAANEVIRNLLTCPKPVIAAIHGHVRAGGMGFAGACDLVVAGPQASFGLTEVRIGVVAAMISPVVLARIGDRTAAQWLLRARSISPHEAAAAGFITHAVDEGTETVEDIVETMLADLRRGAPRALAASKEIFNRRVLDLVEASEAEMIELSGRFFAGDDAKAGMQSFLNKTAPPWVLDR